MNRMNGRVQGLSRIHTTGCVFPLLLLYLFLPSEWHKCSWNISKWRQCGPRCQILITVADETEEEKEKRGGRERGCESCSGEQTHTFNAVHLCTLSKSPTPPHPKKEGFTSQNPLCAFAVVRVYQRKQISAREKCISHITTIATVL